MYKKNKQHEEKKTKKDKTKMNPLINPLHKKKNKK